MPRGINPVRTAANIIRGGELAAVTLLSGQLRGSLYQTRMEAVEPLTPEERLNIGGSVGRFGLPVHGNVLFEVTRDGVRYEIELIDVLVSVNYRNTIVTTPTQGRRGTVKEYIKGDDYQVSMTGSLVSEKQNAFPLEKLQLFVSILEEEGQIPVASAFLGVFGITRLVLDSYDFKQEDARYMNSLPFSLKFLSDEDVNLIISEED